MTADQRSGAVSGPAEPGHGGHQHEHAGHDHADHDDHDDADHAGHDHERRDHAGEAHDHGHAHEHGEHGQAGAGRAGAGWRRLAHQAAHLVRPHSHDASDRVDSALESSRRGVRAVWVSFAALLATAALQAVVVAVSGSVALLGDTLHNVADALTAVPLAVAFVLGRRAASRRFTYGLGRAEDLAGLVVLALIAASSVAAGWQAVHRLLDLQEVRRLWLVAVAAGVGFVGNEAVARYRIRVGRSIGSAALVADGLHARTDALTSLSVVVAAGGAAVGWRWADPVVGLVITVAIGRVLVSAAGQVFGRMLDAVDPALVQTLERTLAGTPGVHRVAAVRVRWVGHALHADCDITADPALSLVDAHALAHDAEHRLRHAAPKLAGAVVHVGPAGAAGDAHHATVAHHDPA